ncbi:MAG: STAS domain-containing protein [Magnetococcales bacterium]|nr:STAS domain-containing protein [Magnetococcales bacterium]
MFGGSGITSQLENGTLTIHLGRKFDNAAKREFQSAYVGREEVRRYVIDFRTVTMVDSAALGMLLILRAKAGEEHVEVTLRHLKDAILSIFKVAHFDKLFRIE